MKTLKEERHLACHKEKSKELFQVVHSIFLIKFQEIRRPSPGSNLRIKSQDKQRNFVTEYNKKDNQGGTKNIKFMTTTLYINVKSHLFLKINLTIKQLLTRKNMTWRRHFILQGPSFSSLKYEKENKQNFSDKSISFIITLGHWHTEFQRLIIFAFTVWKRWVIIQINHGITSF